MGVEKSFRGKFISACYMYELMVILADMVGVDELGDT